MITFESIKTKLTEQLNPLFLEIIDESEKHFGHSGYRPRGETHFYVKIVSNKFKGMDKLSRQKMIYKILADELSTQIHALSLKTLTPDEYEL